MRRVFRHFFTICSIASLLLCVAACVLWLRSYWVGESLRKIHEKGLWDVAVSRGIFSVYHERIVDPNASYVNYDDDGSDQYKLRHDSEPDPSVPDDGPIRPGSPDVILHYGSFRIGRHDGTGSSWESIIWYVTVPCFVLAILLSILPLVLAASWIRQRRRNAEGNCPTCGYDLRASPERCPECGMVRPGIQEIAGR
jgi:hypothetical protein